MLYGERSDLKISQSERFLGNYNQWRSHGSKVDTVSSDLREDDVWSMVNGHDYSPTYSYENSGSTNSTTRRTPRDEEVSERLSHAFDDFPEKNISGNRIFHQFCGQDSQRSGTRYEASSLPLNVPNWNKIYRINSIESMPDFESSRDNEKSNYSDVSDVIVPPHEYLATRRNSAANSVFEGVGRTLKGRDMSRVRDAVWSQTGFYG